MHTHDSNKTNSDTYLISNEPVNKIFEIDFTDRREDEYNYIVNKTCIDDVELKTVSNILFSDNIID
jgi:hypothetical protein